MTISVETSVRVCEALGLSTRLMKPRGRPGGEVAVRRAIDSKYSEVGWRVSPLHGRVCGDTLARDA